MQERIRQQAEEFITQETQFHLGFLPTEQSNPLTKTLEQDFKRSPADGVRTLQRVDRNVLEMARRVLASEEYARLVEAGLRTIREGGRIIFSGCGATGRLSILLEAMWRTACAEHPEAAKLADQVESIMTGGDYALVRSVEFFEDYASFGRRQVAEAKMTAKDLLVAITEGGETSSVLGTVAEAADRGAGVFLLFNNPADLLASRLERCRRAITDPRVCVLDLHCGPMALAGSTRMQATTSEQLIAGAALETVLHRLLGKPERDYAADFGTLLDALEAEANVQAIADYMAFEADIYRNQGKLTYFANDFLLDIFTDTTERSPTFMLPPFRRRDNKTAPQSWAFVKNPLVATPDAWNRSMRRPLRCLNWTAEDYVAMGAGEKISSRPPALAAADLLQFAIGQEDLEERYDSGRDAAVLIAMRNDPELEAAFVDASGKFAHTARLAIDTELSDAFQIMTGVDSGTLKLMQHLALKLVLNTVSTGTMALLGRITGNWMSWVDCTNKKLLDRGARLLVEIAGVDYRTACENLFAALEEIQKVPGEKPSAVQVALQWLHQRDLVSLEDFIKCANQGWKLVWMDGQGTARSITPAAMRHSAKTLSADKRQATFTWNGHADAGDDFSVTVSWEQTEDGRFAGKLCYDGWQGQQAIEEIHFPVVSHDFDIAGRFLYGGWDMGHLSPKDRVWGRSPIRHAQRSMQFNAVVNPHGQSWYFDSRDPDWNIKFADISVSADRMKFTYAAVYLCPLPKTVAAAGGVPYVSSVKPYRGSWYEAAQIYKPWATQQSWAVNRPHENPLRDIAMWVWNRGRVEDVVPTVERLQKDCGQAKVALDWYWWHSNPYDTDYPNFWPPRDGVEAFQAAVKRLTDQGIYTQVYVNSVCWDMDGDNWHEGGADGVVKKRDGSLHAHAFNRYNLHRLAWMCGEAEAYQDKISELIGRLADSGLTGQYLDMIGCATFTPCYNSAHRHDLGGGNYHVRGFRKLLERLRAENPGYTLTTETSSEPYMDLCDGGIICASCSHEHLGGIAEIVPLFTAVHHGSFAAFGNYAHPDGIPPWDPKWPDQDRWQNEKPWHKIYPDQFFVEMARPVVWGAQPMVCHIRPAVQNDPEFAAIYKFIIDTAQFYNEHRDFLFDGQMLSPDGFSCAEKEVQFLARMIFTKEADARVITKQLPCVLHGCWQAPDGRKALFLANYTADPQEWTFRGKAGVLPARTYRKIDLE